MNRPRPALSPFVAALLFHTVLLGCGDGGKRAGDAPSQGPPPPVPGFLPVTRDGSDAGIVRARADVRYTEGTVVVDPDEVGRDLLGVSPDLRSFLVRRGAAVLQDARPGSIIVLAGQGVGRVREFRDHDGAVEVVTDSVDLGEVIQDGTLEWQYDIDWTRLPAPREVQVAWAEDADRPRVAQASLFPMASPAAFFASQLDAKVKWAGVMQGWNVSLELTPVSPERMDFQVKGTRDYGGTRVGAVSAEGHISNFTQETLLTYQNSKPGQMVVKAVGLDAEVEVKWAAFKPEGTVFTQVQMLNIPLSLPIRVPVGGIPMQINLKAVLQVVPELRVDKASSSGSFKARFRSDQGVTYENSAGGPIGKLLSSDVGVSGETVTAGMGPAAFAVGIEFPRLEVGLWGLSPLAFVTVKTYSQSLWTPGTTLTNDIPPCQMGKTEVFAIAGYKVQLAGIPLAAGDTEIWRAEYVKYLEDKPCSLTGKM